MLNIGIELTGRNKTLRFGIFIGSEQVVSTRDRLDDVIENVETCIEGTTVPNIDVLRKVEDDWVKAGIIV